jgi:two-component system NtrC family response regulator
VNTILVVDNEVNYLRKMEALLGESGYVVIAALSTIEAFKIACASDLDLVLTEMKMPKMSGIDLMDDIRRFYSDLPVIIMANNASVEQAVKAIKKGAFDLILKHYKDEEILVTIAKALDHRHLLKNLLPQQELQKKHSFPNIVGESRPMQEILALVKRVAQSRATVLITGESGTGKDLIARVIHQGSQLAHKSFVLANCLFGGEQSDFTHATGTRKSRFELADGGTLFIGELADMSQELQGELLGLLQEMEFERKGGSRTTKMDVRVVAASNRDLKKEVEAGRFREDLFYRLNVVHLHVPPLRQRQEDIPLLAAHFVNKFAQENSKGNMLMTPDALRLMSQYAWPGNVRELENVMERAVILCHDNLITPDDLPAELTSSAAGEAQMEIDRFVPLHKALPETLEAIEEQMIRRALEKSGQVQTRAAEMLGITKSLLQYKLKKYHLTI